MTPRQKLTAYATAAFLAVSGALYVGTLTATGDASGLYGEVTPPGAPTPTTCVWREGYTDPATLGLWVPGYEGGASYALVLVCVDAPPDDGGDVGLPAEYAALPSTYPALEAPIPYDGGAHMRVWVQGHPAAPWQCACAASTACLANGGPAHLGITLAPGTWSGGGCVPKPCTEWAGMTSWPAACPSGAP